MKRRKGKTWILFFACIIVLTMCSCGKEKNSNKGQEQNGKKVWYLGGNNDIFADDIDVESLFQNVEDTIEPQKIYDSLEFTEEMFHGVYMLNNKEKDLKKVRKEVPFEELESNGETVNISILPTAVYLGANDICNSETNYKYAKYRNVVDQEVAVIEFATEDNVARMPSIYEVSGNTITFQQIRQTSRENEPFTYELGDLEFKYNFKFSGPSITFTKGKSALTLKAFCLTENTDKSLNLSGYSKPDSPLISSLDYFSSTDTWNYAVKRDGGRYSLSAYKIADDGRITVCLEDKDGDGERKRFMEQYAYIIQSSANSFLNDFRIILLDGRQEYYYNDNVTQREVRALEEQGTDINELKEEEIKEIAEKKSDLFDDLYKEFEAQGIHVIVNHSTGEVALDASVLFGGDSAVITDAGKALLNKFLTAFTAIVYNEKYDGFISKIMVEGHAAPVLGGTYESALPISQERADNVKNYCLSSDTGVDVTKLSSMLEAQGLSNSKPVYDSNGEVDMEGSRRVSFRFIVNIQKN